MGSTTVRIITALVDGIELVGEPKARQVETGEVLREGVRKGSDHQQKAPLRHRVDRVNPIACGGRVPEETGRRVVVRQSVCAA